jgi:hypothetical protein
MDCGCPPDCPQIINTVWHRLGLNDETLLCLDCFERRATRRLTIDDVEIYGWMNRVLRRLINRAKEGRI